MTLQDLGSIGEFIAAFATVVTLVYLAVQIRQNTQTVRANTQQAGSTAWSELVLKMASDPAMSEIYHQGRVSPESLSKEDARRFALTLDAMFSQIENFYIQYAYGHLPQSNQDRFALILRLQFETRGVNLYWARHRSEFTAEFIHYVEDELGLA